ncbi:hypothetical protein CPB83DRAFT_894865 [Crepidotus variabilis]|uniref:Uncharacterized protein n=1 Tax=Crepidotus variabilis TaxID=179855 RepID=A0A9P6EF63_9AGAR|nr:hypothetical protein CPB83DRAFT_894865 [Crepidotus variabilis]
MADDSGFDDYYTNPARSKSSKMERSSESRTRHDYDSRYSREESTRRDGNRSRTVRAHYVSGSDRDERPEHHRSSKEIDERVRRASAAINERMERESNRDKYEHEHIPERGRDGHNRHSKRRPTSRSVERKQPRNEPVDSSGDRHPSSTSYHAESRGSVTSEQEDRSRRATSSRHTRSDSLERTRDRHHHDSSSSSESSDDGGGSSRHKKRKHRDRERLGSRERDRKKRKKKDKESRRKDKDGDERRSVLTGKKIKLKVKKDKGDHERDANREKLLKFLNSAYE